MLWRICAFAALGGFLFGCSPQSQIRTAPLQLGRCLHAANLVIRDLFEVHFHAYARLAAPLIMNHDAHQACVGPLGMSARTYPHMTCPQL